MKAIISPSALTGKITAPPSKSAMQRACAAALIRRGRSIISNPGYSADDKAALSIVEQLGGTVNYENDKIIIESNGVHPKTNSIDAGESGLSARLFTSIAAISEKEITVNGRGSLLKRPFHFFDEILPALGVNCNSNNGHLPLTIKGPLVPADIKVDGSLSSQYLTGMIMAYAASDVENVSIEVSALKSKPYIDLTLDILNKFKCRVPQNNNYTFFDFGKAANPNNSLIEYTVEGDWSGAAFLLVAGAVAGEITVKGLDVFSSQADRAVMQPLMQSAAGMSIEETQVTVRPGLLQPFHFNATDCPDLFPPLVALAAFCKGTSVIEGVHRLAHKESDRGQTLMQEMKKLGIEISVQDDLMLIKGGGVVNAAIVNSHGDHRIAMACAVVALKATGEVVIENAGAVEKSYPSFFEDLKVLGASISLINN
jgi:3-phosphoshikimate 1-carboxyvinyltransferase